MGPELVAQPKLWCDNTSNVLMAAKPIHHASFKYCELDLHFVREKVLEGKLMIDFVPTEEHVNILTKFF